MTQSGVVISRYSIEYYSNIGELLSTMDDVPEQIWNDIVRRVIDTETIKNSAERLLLNSKYGKFADIEYNDYRGN